MSSMCVRRASGARLVNEAGNVWRSPRRALAVRGALLALLLGGCARAPSPYNWSIEPEGGADASDPGEPCDMGESEPCDCDDGTINGRRTCAADPTSPRYGYLTECSGCQPPPGVDAGNMDGSTPTPEAGAPDAQQPDAQPADARPPESGTPDGSGGPGCSDGQKNGTETDTDCGGAACGGCAAGKMCLAPAA
jgi:hypothetical protein